MAFTSTRNTHAYWVWEKIGSSCRFSNTKCYHTTIKRRWWNKSVSVPTLTFRAGERPFSTLSLSPIPQYLPVDNKWATRQQILLPKVCPLLLRLALYGTIVNWYYPSPIPSYCSESQMYFLVASTNVVLKPPLLPREANHSSLLAH